MPDKKKPAAKKKTANDIIAESVIKAIETHGVDEDRIGDALDRGAVKYINANKVAISTAIMEMAKKEIAMPKVIEVKKPDGGKAPKVAHKQFEELVKVVASGVPALMVGMPGTGKTTAAEHVADQFNIPFESISVGIQTTKTDILGFTDAGGTYQPTAFRRAFENGGVFLMDEVDAGNPNVLIVINSAISNGWCSFPDGMVHAHEDFKFIATANTFGTGADTKFIGRNQLDEATLDRFITINWEIDEFVEDALVTKKDWLTKVRKLRTEAARTGRDMLVSPRVSIYGSQLIEAGFNMRKAAEMTILKGKDNETQKYIKDVMGI